MNYQLDRFQAGLQELKITLSDHQYEQFLSYYEMLIEKNKVMNLTAITEFDEVIEKHFLDSLSLVRLIPDLNCQKILDLGTGAGFPGIPLKIAFPDLNVVLMDSLNKRVLFLQDVIQSLNLKNITAVHGRAEEAASRKEYRQQFDLCVSRAVANLSTLSEYCLPFVKVNGAFVPYKSGEIDEEVSNAKKAISVLGGYLAHIERFCLPDSEYKRTLLLIEKKKGTPKQYPRKAGTPAKNPIQ